MAVQPGLCWTLSSSSLLELRLSNINCFCARVVGYVIPHTATGYVIKKESKPLLFQRSYKTVNVLIRRFLVFLFFECTVRQELSSVRFSRVFSVREFG